MSFLYQLYFEMPQAILKFTIACPELASGVNADITAKSLFRFIGKHSERSELKISEDKKNKQ